MKEIPEEIIQAITKEINSINAAEPHLHSAHTDDLVALYNNIEKIDNFILTLKDLNFENKLRLPKIKKGLRKLQSYMSHHLNKKDERSMNICLLDKSKKGLMPNYPPVQGRTDNMFNGSRDDGKSTCAIETPFQLEKSQMICFQDKIYRNAYRLLEYRLLAPLTSRINYSLISREELNLFGVLEGNLRDKHWLMTDIEDIRPNTPVITDNAMHQCMVDLARGFDIANDELGDDNNEK